MIIGVGELQNRLVGQARIRTLGRICVGNPKLERKCRTRTRLVNHVRFATWQNRRGRIGRTGAVPILRTARLEQRRVTADIRTVARVGNCKTDTLAVPYLQRMLGRNLAVARRNVRRIGRSHVVKIVFAAVGLHAGVVRAHAVKILSAAAFQHDGYKHIWTLGRVGNGMHNFGIEQPVPAKAVFFWPARGKHVIFSLGVNDRAVPDIVVLHRKCHTGARRLKRKMRCHGVTSVRFYTRS